MFRDLRFFLGGLGWRLQFVDIVRFCFGFERIYKGFTVLGIRYRREGYFFFGFRLFFSRFWVQLVLGLYSVLLRWRFWEEIGFFCYGDVCFLIQILFFCVFFLEVGWVKRGFGDIVMVVLFFVGIQSGSSDGGFRKRWERIWFRVLGKVNRSVFCVVKCFSISVFEKLS